MGLFLVVVVIWFLIGSGTGIYVTLLDEDIIYKDIPIILLCGVFGPFILGALFAYGGIKIPKLFDKNAVLFKKFKNK